MGIGKVHVKKVACKWTIILRTCHLSRPCSRFNDQAPSVNYRRHWGWYRVDNNDRYRDDKKYTKKYQYNDKHCQWKILYMYIKHRRCFHVSPRKPHVTIVSTLHIGQTYTARHVSRTSLWFHVVPRSDIVCQSVFYPFSCLYTYMM